MTKGKQHYKNKIIEGSPVKAFFATNTALLEYPYVLGRPEYSSPTLAKQADEYILDSGIGNDDITTEDIIERGDDIGATTLVPKDNINNPTATTDAVIEMLTQTDKDILIPLQSDETVTHYQHYCDLSDKLQEIGEDITDFTVALGGIRDESIEDQILTAVNFRDNVGQGVDVHAFGCGIHHEWVVAIRKRPELIDSLDTSILYQTVNKGTVFDAMMEKRDYELARGRNSTCIFMMQKETSMYVFNHAISEFANENDVPTEFESETLSKVFNSRE